MLRTVIFTGRDGMTECGATSALRSCLSRFLLTLNAVALVMLSCGCAAFESGSGVDSFVYVSGNSPGIHCYTYNAKSGALTASSVSDGGNNPSYMAFAPDHKTAYAVNEGAGATVRAYKVNPMNGALTLISTTKTGGAGACHLSVHPSGKWVYVAHYSSGHISVLPVASDASLSEPIEVILAGEKAHMAIADAEGKFLFVPTLGLDQVQVYRIDQSTGRLIKNNPSFISLPEKAGPRHMAISPDQKHAYVINELNWTLTSFSYDAEQGRASGAHSIPTMADYAGKGSCAHVMVSRDGRFVYGSNRGHNSIVICKIEPVSGKLTVVGHESANGEIRTPRNFNIDPSGNFMIVASQDGNYVTIFEINKDTGLLSKRSQVACGEKPTFVGFLPRH